MDRLILSLSLIGQQKKQQTTSFYEDPENHIKLAVFLTYFELIFRHSF